jgi:hypothetical protein
MQIRSILLAFLIGLTYALTATPVSTTSNTTLDKNLLLLPPPSVLNVVEVGTTWAKLSWTPVAGAISYEIVTKEFFSGNIVNIQNVAAANIATVNGLTPGVAYYSEIRSIDINNEKSDTPTLSERYDTIIIELVNSGFQIGSGSDGECIVDVKDFGCDYEWSASPTYFKISTVGPNPQSRIFKLNVAPNNITTQVTRAISGSTLYTFSVDADNKILTIKYGSGQSQQVAAILSVAHEPTSPTGEFFRTSSGQSGNFILKNWIPSGGAKGGNDRDLSFTEVEFSKALTASPNPFNNQLEVNIPFTNDDQDLTINLYNLQGSRIFSQTYPAGTPMVTLSTEGFANGMYVLQAVSGTHVASIKVMKTQ